MSMRRHTILHDALHTSETDAETALHQFTNGTDAAVTQVVDVIRFFLRDVQANDFASKYLRDLL
jgi:hypothetical protein